MYEMNKLKNYISDIKNVFTKECTNQTVQLESLNCGNIDLIRSIRIYKDNPKKKRDTTKQYCSECKKRHDFLVKRLLGPPY